MTGGSKEDGYMVRPYGVADAGPVGTFDGMGGLTSSLRPDRLLSDVLIEAPSMQSRRITATILVEGDVDEIWQILTDYDNLSTHVPNLVQSYRIPTRPDGTTNNYNNGNRSRDRYSFNNPNFADQTSATRANKEAINTRIFQEGAQKILGFDFRASLKMDMSEDKAYTSRNNGNAKSLQFKLAESFMFSAFEGSWIVKPHSRLAAPAGNNNRRRANNFNTNNGAENTQRVVNVSQLTYNVFIKPRGPVPVAALEWRIREDVPVNLLAVKKAVEDGAYYRIASRKRNNQENKGKGLLNRLGIQKQRDPFWDADETLESYIS